MTARDPLKARFLDAERPPNASLTPSSVLRFEHRLEQSGLFNDDALEILLDSLPRRQIEVTTMGRRFEDGGWRSGRVGDLSGAELLRAIREGHLWLNVKELHVAESSFRDLLAELYDELAHHWGVPTPSWRAATLLVSSPCAFVHYHADSVPNILWQLRGRKRVFVYPVTDPRMAPPEILEKICAGEKDEGLPYLPEFEEHVEVFDLVPGQAISWPQNSPHRVENLEGLNLSLSTEHLTSRARRRVDVLRANRLLRRRRGPSRLTTKLDGLGAQLKVLLSNSQRVLRKLGGRGPTSFTLPPEFRVDPTADGGFVDELGQDERDPR